MSGAVDLAQIEQIKRMQAHQNKEKLFGLAAEIYSKMSTEAPAEASARIALERSLVFWETCENWLKEKQNEHRKLSSLQKP